MAVIYEPKGRAREYAPLAANLYDGCVHGCTYCWAPSCLHRQATQFHGDAHPRKDILENLAKDAQKLRNRADPVLLCFITDPYQPVDTSITRLAIEILHANSIGVQILTKGGTRALRDFDILGAKDAFASTLTFVSPDESAVWEPKAASPADRFNALRLAHEVGIQTWASLEPVIDPEQSLELIRLTAGYVDLFKVGTLNYHAMAESIDWASFARRAVSLLESLGKDFYLKRDLCEKAGLPYHEPEAARRHVPQAAASQIALL